MKTRTGFVSNSSSSSFVVLGVRVDGGTFEKLGGYEYFEDQFSYVDLPEGEDDAIVGEKIGRWSDSDGGINEKSLVEFYKALEKVQKELKAVFPDQELTPSLIYGSVYG